MFCAWLPADLQATTHKTKVSHPGSTTKGMKDIHRLAETQHGLIRRSQALQLGYPGRQVERMVSSRRLEPAARSVYRVPGSVSTHPQRLLAAVWRRGDGALAARLAAGALWELPG